MKNTVESSSKAIPKTVVEKDHFLQSDQQPATSHHTTDMSPLTTEMDGRLLKASYPETAKQP